MDRLKVMIADDATGVRRRLERMIGRSDRVAVVSTAATADETKREFDRLQPDAVILDIRFPDGNGLKLLHHIKQKREDTQVIMLTNQANDYYREAAMDLGATHFFDKSRQFHRVVDALEDIAGRQ